MATKTWRLIEWPLWGTEHDSERPFSAMSEGTQKPVESTSSHACRSQISIEFHDREDLGIVHDHPGSTPEKAALAAAEELRTHGIAIMRDVIPTEAFSVAREAIGDSTGLLNRIDLQQDDAVLDVLENGQLCSLMKQVLSQLQLSTTTGKDCIDLQTTNYKWLRSVGDKLYTGLHQDYFYLGNDAYLTAWIPFLPETRLEHGTLVWLGDKAHDNASPLGEVDAVMRSGKRRRRSRSFTEQEIPAQEKPELQDQQDSPLRPAKTSRAESNGTTSGWLHLDASEFQVPPDKTWRSTWFKEGDVAIFDMRLLHMTVPNLSKRNRISCDTRWRLTCRDESQQCAMDMNTRRTAVTTREGSYYDAEQLSQVKEPRMRWITIPTT